MVVNIDKCDESTADDSGQQQQQPAGGETNTCCNNNNDHNNNNNHHHHHHDSNGSAACGPSIADDVWSVALFGGALEACNKSSPEDAKTGPSRLGTAAAAAERANWATSSYVEKANGNCDGDDATSYVVVLGASEQLTDRKFDHKVGSDDNNLDGAVHGYHGDAREQPQPQPQRWRKRQQQVAKLQSSSLHWLSANNSDNHANSQTNNTSEYSDHQQNESSRDELKEQRQDDYCHSEAGEEAENQMTSNDVAVCAPIATTTTTDDKKGDINQRQDHRLAAHTRRWQRAGSCQPKDKPPKTTTARATGDKIIDHRQECEYNNNNNDDHHDHHRQDEHEDEDDDDHHQDACGDDEKSLDGASWTRKVKLLKRRQRRRRENQKGHQTLINYDSASSEFETIISMLTNTNRQAAPEPTQTPKLTENTTTTTTTSTSAANSDHQRQINKFNYMSDGDVDHHKHLCDQLHDVVVVVHDHLLSGLDNRQKEGARRDNNNNNNDNHNKELRNISEFNYIPNEQRQQQAVKSEWKQLPRQRFNSLNLNELELAHQNHHNLPEERQPERFVANHLTTTTITTTATATATSSSDATTPETDRHNQVNQRRPGEQTQRCTNPGRLLNSSDWSSSSSSSSSSVASVASTSVASSSSLASVGGESDRDNVTSSDLLGGGFDLLTLKRRREQLVSCRPHKSEAEQSQERPLVAPVGMDLSPKKPIMQPRSTGLSQVVVASSQQQAQAMPKCYPNNTLLEDLARCHQGVTDLFPGASRATQRTKELFKSCLTLPLTRKRRKPLKTTTTTSTLDLFNNQPTVDVIERQLKVDIEGGGDANHIEDVNANSTRKQQQVREEQTPHQQRHNNDDNDGHGHGHDHELDDEQKQHQKKQFRPTRRRRKFNYHIPESILRTNSSLQIDDYDRALSVLTSDIRFKLHLLLYRRCQFIWTLITTVLCILIPTLLLEQLEFIVIISACSTWLGLQLLGVLLTTQTRRKLDRMLEKSVAQANSFFMDHNLMLGVINVGGLFTKTRLLIPMLYFDTSQCRERIESIISTDLRQDDADDTNDNKQQGDQKHKQQPALDYSKIGLPLTKANVMALAQSQLAKKIVLRYSQRWISYFDKRKLMFNDDKVKPRHLSTGKCLCQFVEEYFRSNRLEAKNDLDEEERALHNQEVQRTSTRPVSCSQEQSISGTIDDKNNNYNNQTKVQTISNNTNRSDYNQKDLIVKKSRNGIFTRNNNQLITTLSHVVDMQHYNANQSETISDDFSDDNDEEDVDSIDQTNLSNERTTNSTSPVTDVSSDLDGTTNSGDVLSSDDLIKKLRFILELRKNDLDGNLNIGLNEQQYDHPTFLNGYKQHATSIVMNADDNHFGIFNNNLQPAKVDEQRHNESRKYKLGKVGLLTPTSLKATFVGKNKFFNQSSKKVQQQQVGNDNVKQVDIDETEINCYKSFR